MDNTVLGTATSARGWLCTSWVSNTAVHAQKEADAPQADEELVDQQPQSGGGEEESVEVEQGSPRYEAFAASVLQILNAAGDEDGVHVDTVMPQINTAGGQQYSRAEADAILRLMESENQVMYESDLIYLI